jgi:hypothetical protein
MNLEHGARSRVKTVGRRSTSYHPVWADLAALQASADALRGTTSLAPGGVYRFSTFEEAERWLTTAIAERLARRPRKTWRASAVR